MKHAALFRLLVLLVASASVAGCDSAIVGAECKTGFTLCDGVCVNLRADFRNCGSCGHSCGRFACDDGSCSTTKLQDGGSADAGKLDGSMLDDGSMAEGGSGDGGLGDGGTGDGSMGEGGPGEGGTGEGGTGEGGTGEGGTGEGGTGDGGGLDPDAGLGGCGLGEQICGGGCSNPVVDPTHCGSCDTACMIGEVCSDGSCAVQCDPPLVQCDGACFDLTSDPDHCGACGMHCTSGICEDGQCADAIAGQAVVIGHDFKSANSAMRRLAGNAVFLGRGAPVRVLVYRGEANAASVTGVETAIDVVKRELGRDWMKVDAIESIVPLQLATADVLLVHAQEGATRSTLEKLGQQWGAAVAQFLLAGGVVVVFDTPSSNNDGTYRVLEPAHIFEADSRETVTSQQLILQTPGLGVAVRVPDRYMSATNTVHFNNVTSPGSFVVVDKDGKPVVVQRVIVR
jgi:hypothetical protein